MASIRSLLSRSQLLKHSFEFTRRKLSESYRRVHTRDNMARYREVVRPNLTTPSDGFDDSGLAHTDFELQAHPTVQNPVITRSDVTDAWVRFVADPFLVYADGLYHLFFEICTRGWNVCIGHAFSTDGYEYEYNQIVLQPETAQHTYPHVFRYDGRWLLVPSPGANVTGEFRIYEATEFPTEWALAATPITEEIRLDPTPIRHEDGWYLVYQSLDDYKIKLQYADSLTGDWQTHPESPIFSPDAAAIDSDVYGKAEMVPSGRPLYIDDEIHLWYRSHANRDLSRYRITDLSRDRFRQEPFKTAPLIPASAREVWNQAFMHTVNPVYPWKNTANLVAVDGMRADKNIWSIGIYFLAGGAE